MKYPCRLEWKLDAKTGKWSCVHEPYRNFFQDALTQPHIKALLFSLPLSYAADWIMGAERNTVG